MPNRPYKADLIATELRRRVAAAWGCSQVFERVPASPVALPYAVVLLGEATKAADSGANCYASVYSFTIVGRFAWPSDGTRETAFKTDKANDLFEALFNGQRRFHPDGDTDEAAVGMMHQIGSVNFEELGEEQNRSLELLASFTIRDTEDTFLY